MEYRAISFAQKFGLFHEQWQPKVIAEMNDYQFKVVKLQGDFIWHDHKDTDETFTLSMLLLRFARPEQTGPRGFERNRSAWAKLARTCYSCL